MVRREAEGRATFVAAEHTTTCTTRSADCVKYVHVHVYSVLSVRFTARQSSVWVLTDLGGGCTSGDTKVNGEVEIVHQAEG